MKVVPKDLKKLAAAQRFEELAVERLWDNEYFPDDAHGIAAEVMDREYPEGDWGREHETYENEQDEVLNELWCMFISREHVRLLTNANKES
ncbi:hypothetical protein LCGC14_1424400 [marine sediment metagenome]|uniref:Uncharacterized protein n=1 Tax=marine sediment metagenome TaxID=412755 RepID=A0A0F9JQ89_9ZZZZ